MSYSEQSIWFFCRRYLKTEYPQQQWKEAAMQKLQDDEDFHMTLVPLQDTGVSYNPLW